MKRIIVIPWALAVMSLSFTGCTSPVGVNSNPSGAEIKTVRGGVIGITPQRVYPGSYSLVKAGYEPKKVMVPYQSGGTIHVELEKIIPTIVLSSKPSEADIYDASNNLIGQTPLSVSLTESRTYDVRKFGYASKSVLLTESSASKIEVDLGDPLGGMTLMRIAVGESGLEVRSSLVFSEKDVIERSPSVKAVRKLTDFSSTRWIGRFRLFPDDKRMLMDILDKEAVASGAAPLFSNLWAMDVSGSGGLQRWTEGKYLDEAPSFSEDGNFIYFGSSRAGKNAIFRMSITNLKGLGMVTPGSTADSYPQISPDGNTLMWTASMTGSDIPQLWSMPLKSGLPNGLPMQIREGSEPRWSPNGSLILFTAVDRNLNKAKIWTMEPDGSRPTQLTTASNCNDVDPQWSPDGSHILFSSDLGVSNGRPNFDIWMMGADGSNPRQLTTNGSHDDRPIFSHDGTTIYFRSNRGLKWDIWVMQLAEVQ